MSKGVTHVPEPGRLTIGQLLKLRAQDMPGSLFGIFPDRHVTFGELDQQARVIAKGLIAFGITPGAHVATLMPNCADWLAACFGIFYAGGRVVALNARYKRHELAFAIVHSQSRALITTDAIADHVDLAALVADSIDLDAQLGRRLAPDLRCLLLMGRSRRCGFQSLENFVALGSTVTDDALDAALAVTQPADVAALIYTSGTTSNPKGCALTHIGIERSWATFADVVDLQPAEIVWTPMPFFHTGGIGPMTAILARGATLMTQSHFSPEEAVRLIAGHRIAHLYSGFPQFSLAVLRHPAYSKEGFAFVRSMLNVGPPAIQARIQELLPDGAVLLNLFGMTEGAGIVTFTPADAPLHVRANTSGKPPAHTEVRIADPETGQLCAEGIPGEIQFRGGGAFAFYHGDPEATRDTILDGGWVKTGDRGLLDAEGYLSYLGRLKDMLKVGGENVAAAEIEFFLAQHPAVKMVQVIGVPDDRLTEIPIAFVEVVPDQVVSEQDLLAMCDGQLATWKIPRAVIFVSEWPLSSTKVQKFRLRDLLPDRYRSAKAQT